MQVATRGAGPPLVLLHGWAMHAGLFGRLLDRLAERRTLHLVDLPGHGFNRDAATPLALDACVHAIAEATPPAPWLGWSLGGLFALRAAATRPAAVPALVMLCATPRFGRAPDWPHGMDAAVFRAFGAHLGDDYRGTIERFLALETFGCERATAELRTLRAEVFAHGEPAPAALADGLHLLETVDLRASLPTLRTPSLWIGARRDRLVDWRAVAAAAGLAPHATFLRVDSGHAPFLTDADTLAGSILGFLDAASGKAASRPSSEGIGA